MYFLPRSNKFNAWVVTVKPLHLYILTGLALGAIAGAWLFGVYFNLNAMILQKQHEIEQSKQQALQIKHIQDAELATKLAVQELHASIKEYSGGKDHPLQSVLLFLINKAAEHKLIIQSYSADKVVDKDWYTENVVHIDVSGAFDDLLYFFTAISSYDYLISVDQINITRISDRSFNLRSVSHIMEIKK